MSAQIIAPRVLVRIAREDEIDELEELDRATLPEAPPTPETDWWGAWCGHELVGYAGGRFIEGVYYLTRAGVAYGFRGRGIQKRLIRVRLRHAETLGAEWCVTYTVVGNPASVNSLIACGFRSYNPQAPWVGEGVNYWRRALRRPVG
jgi:GNAT superfamily N-acetyltransferase